MSDVSATALEEELCWYKGLGLMHLYQLLKSDIYVKKRKKSVVEAEVGGENKCTFCVCNIHSITFKITPRHIRKINIKY